MFGRVVPASQLGPTLRHSRCLQGITAGVAACIDKAGVCRGSAGSGVCLLVFAGSLASRELDAEQTEYILRQSSILSQLNAPAVHVSTDMYLHSFARYSVGHLEGRPCPAEVFQGSVQGLPGCLPGGRPGCCRGVLSLSVRCNSSMTHLRPTCDPRATLERAVALTCHVRCASTVL